MIADRTRKVTPTGLEGYRAHRIGGAYEVRLRKQAQKITMLSGNRVVTSPIGLGGCFCCEGFHLQSPSLPLGCLFKDKSHK